LFRYEIAAISGQRQVVAIPHKPWDLDNWQKIAGKIENRYSKRLGVLTGPISVLCHVSLLKGLKRTEEGAFIKEFLPIAGQDSEFALQTIVENVISKDSRYVERKALDVEEEYPDGSKVFFLGEYHYGRPAYVSGYTDGKTNIYLSVPIAKEPPFGRTIVNQPSLKIYFPAQVVAEYIGLSFLCLSKLTSAFFVSVEYDRVNLGLNIKFEGKQQKVLGYSRKNQNGWEYTDTVCYLLQEYKSRFPEFIYGLERNVRNDSFSGKDFYPPAVAKAKIKQIQEWLKSQEVKNLERVSLDTEEIDLEIIQQLEQAQDEYKNIPTDPERIKGVPRKALLKPQDASSRLQHQKFSLGDRVIYVQDSGKVPIASRGNVVGIHEDSLDIVFDFPFMSGSTLGGRCSSHRGMTVSLISVLNLSTPMVVTGTYLIFAVV